MSIVHSSYTLKLVFTYALVGWFWLSTIFWVQICLRQKVDARHVRPTGVWTHDFHIMDSAFRVPEMLVLITEPHGSSHRYPTRTSCTLASNSKNVLCPLFQMVKCTLPTIPNSQMHLSSIANNQMYSALYSKQSNALCLLFQTVNCTLPSIPNS